MKGSVDAVDLSVVIATFNRAADLAATLSSLSGIRTTSTWELIVVDNNCTDDTRGVVERFAAGFPVRLRYIFESRQGRSPALNAGVAAASGDIIVTTDDDVRVGADWLDRIEDALSRLDCDYVGGRVLPIWEAPRPAWLPDHGGKHWAVVALLDYGDHPLEFGSRVPLGVNMAFRRSAFDRAGFFDPETGRKAGTLLGQEVREWCIRARAAGVRGFYVPEIAVRHVVPASRLRKSYFRRWFYWRGISRALLYERAGLDMEQPERAPASGLPELDRSRARRAPNVFGVPRYLYRTALSHARASIAALLRRDTVASFDHELWLWFFAGIVRQRWKDRHGVRATAPLPGRPLKESRW
jgi:glycosyltransferase involved in cell wall biosynthesis